MNISLLLMLLHLFTGCSNSTEAIAKDPSSPAVSTINEIVMYEANPKSFAQGTSFNDITARLNEIKALGVNTLWLMPIYEEGIKNGIGSPYCVKDYKALNTNYGSMADLKTLVSTAQGKGMTVILDWVANHTSWDNAWIADKSWYTQDAAGNIISPAGFNWSDVADLNFDNKDMRAAMVDAMKYWITETNIDGYRCDYAEGVPQDFWTEVITELRQLKGDQLLMLAEGSDSWLYDCGFDMLYGWGFAGVLQNVFSGSASVSDLYKKHQEEYNVTPTGKQRLRYSTNHDLASESSPLQAYKSERGAMSAFVIASTLAGSPLIYSSQEIAYPRALSFFQFIPMDWSSNIAYQQEYQKLMQAYNSSAALRGNGLRTYDTGKVATFCKTYNNERVLVMANTSKESQTIKVPIELAGEEMIDLMSNENKILSAAITLEPYQYYIYSKK